MQILMSKTAFERVRERLAPFAGLEVVTLDKGPVFHRDGAEVAGETVDPEAYWLSVDMWGDGTLPTVFQAVGRGENGRWVQGFMAGLDNPAFKLILQKGVRITKSDAQSPAIAEYVLAHAFSLLHPIAQQAQVQVRHAWERVPFREIASTRWLVVGFGNIGHAIAERLKPFGAHLTVVRRNPAPEPLADDVRPTADLPKLLPDADVIVLAAALNDATRGLADEAFFQAMKPGAVLINIARGGLVDEEALRRGLDRQQPAQAVLDVFATEPLAAAHWAWDHPRVRVTAHCSNAGDGLIKRGDALFLENLRRYLGGEPLLNEAHRSEVGL